VKTLLSTILFLFPFSLMGEANFAENEPQFQFSIVPLAGQDHVDFEIFIKNEGDIPLVFEFPTSQLIEITVTDQKEKEVYRYSTGRFFLQALQTIKIEPQQTFRKITKWNYHMNGEKVSKGQYTVTAALMPRKLNEQPISNKQNLISKKKFTIPEGNTAH
jgi:hypothetical protein